jgi:DNA/RNA endonuclease YhcR with UshA esterase domain
MKVTVEMEVHATGMSPTQGLVFLNSSMDRTSDDNFTIVLDKKAQADLAKAGIKQPRSHFEGKRIRVTGTLTLFRERPQIILSDASQIQVK